MFKSKNLKQLAVEYPYPYNKLWFFNSKGYIVQGFFNAKWLLQFLDLNMKIESFCIVTIFKAPFFSNETRLLMIILFNIIPLFLLTSDP